MGYRRPGRARRRLNAAVAGLAARGLTPRDTVALEVRGRRTGRRYATAVTLAYLDGSEYVVSLAGQSDWVRNVRAAGGAAVLRHGGRREVRLEPVPVEQRSRVLAAYLSKRALTKSPAAAARDYFDLPPYPAAADLEPLAERYPVFRVVRLPAPT